MTKITCISDLHGFMPGLPGGDLLIIAGDLTATDKLEQYEEFYDWALKQDYSKVVCIAGNHDMRVNSSVLYSGDLFKTGKFWYLQDSGIEFDGIKVWGSPWSAWFMGINPACAAFTKKSDDDLKKRWDLIPDDTDVLITHSPSYGVLDKCENSNRVGSRSLLEKIKGSNIKICVHGHIHGSYGVKDFGDKRFVNASCVDERYRLVNKPITFNFVNNGVLDEH